MSEYVYAGLTSQTIDIFLQDSSSTTGAGLAGLVFNSAGLVASYRKGATGSRVAITLATQTVGGAYSSGGFVEIDATNMKGVYRLDIPNAAVDTEGFVTLYLYGATNLLPTPLRIDCRAVPADLKKVLADAQSATDLKDFADAGYDPATNQVAAVLDSAGRLAIWNTLTTQSFTADSFGELIIISDGTNGREVKVTGSGHIAADVHDVQPDGLSGSTEIIAILADTNELQSDWVNGGRLDLILDARASQTSVNTIDDLLDTEVAALTAAVAIISDGVGFLTSVAMGAISDAGTSAETYVITFGGSTYTVDYTGLDATGNRSTTTRTKS